MMKRRATLRFLHNKGLLSWPRHSQQDGSGAVTDRCMGERKCLKIGFSSQSTGIHFINVPRAFTLTFKVLLW